MKTFISIITVCYNEEKRISRTAISVRLQNFSEYEWIVIDGCSTDNTLDILEKKYNPDALISENDNGIYEAMNKGVEIARGDYLLFLNAGDYFFDKNVLYDARKYLEYDLAVGKLFAIKKYIKKRDTIKSWNNRRIDQKYFYRNTLPHQSTFIKKKLFDKIGLYDSRFKIIGDRDFFCRAVFNNSTIRFIPKIISVYSMDGISTKLKYTNIMRKELNVFRRKNYSKKERIQFFFDPAINYIARALKRE